MPPRLGSWCHLCCEKFFCFIKAQSTGLLCRPLPGSLSPGTLSSGFICFQTLQELLCALIPGWALALAKARTPEGPVQGLAIAGAKCLLVPKWLGVALSSLVLDPTGLRGHRGPTSVLWSEGEKAQREALPTYLFIPFGQVEFPSTL